MPARLPLAFAVLAVPLVAAVWAAASFVAENESNRAEARLAAALRSAAAEYVELAAAEERRAARVAARPAVHRAFAERDADELARLERGLERVELALGGTAPMPERPALSGAVEVVVGRQRVGSVRAWRPLDRQLLARLARRADLGRDIRLAVAERGRGIVAPPALVAPLPDVVGQVVEVRLAGGDVRAAAAALPDRRARLVAVTPETTVAAKERRVRNAVVVAGLVTLLSVAVIAYLLAPVLARARVGRQQREQAARVLDHVADGICLLDGDGVVRMWNPAAEAITGLRAQDVVDRPAVDTIPGWHKVEAAVPVSGAPRDAGPGPRSVTMPVDVGGREVWLSLSAVRFSEGTVYAFRDLTDERRLEEMRSDLVTTVSHELRTPLASIHGAALTLRRREGTLDDDTRDDLLAIVAEQSNRLARLADDILLASQLEEGRVALREEPVEVEPVAREAVDAARAQAGGGPTIVLRVRARPLVRADRDKLLQVLGALLDNAIKYSPPSGTVELRVDRADGRVVLSVRDEGIGIPAAEQGRIFEKFYRLDPQLSRGVGGGGLGLYICRELVGRMGGRVRVESEPRAGSTFVVELPAADEAAASAA